MPATRRADTADSSSLAFVVDFPHRAALQPVAMPLNTLTFLPAHWCSAHSDTAPGARDDDHAGLGGRLRLDTLPNEMLLLIAAWLGNRAILALGETSKVCRLVLEELMATIRLERDIGHLVTPSGFTRIAMRVLDVTPKDRERLIRQLGQQRQQFHPSLLPNLQPALDRLAPCGTYDRLVLQLDWDGGRRHQPGQQQHAAPAEPGRLGQILSAPRHHQPRLLIQWLAITGDAGIRQLRPEYWRSIVSGQPAHDVAAVYGAVVTVVTASDPVRWFEALRAALAMAEVLVPSNSAARLGLLSTLATALGAEGPRSAQDYAQRRALWERVLSLLPGLPDAPRRDLLQPMAQYPCFELVWRDAEREASGMAPAWLRMVDTLAPPSEDTDGVADVVCTLLDEVGSRPQRGSAQSMITTLLSRASALTGDERARVLQSAITFLDDRELSEGEFYLQWRAALNASDNLPLQFQALPLQALAVHIQDSFEEFVAKQHNPDGARVPVLWNLLFDRVMRLPEETRLAPALELAVAGSEINDPVQCTAKLIQLAETLPPADRARLLADLVTERDYVLCEPELWVRMVTLVLNLPAAVQVPALAAVIARLTEGYYVMEEVSPDAPSVPLGPDDSEICIWPESAREAYKRASRALSLLPTAAVGALLEKLAASTNADVVRWALREITRFDPDSDEYKAAIVTKACAAVARKTDLPSGVLDDLWPMVKSIPSALRASALQYVRDLLARGAHRESWDEALAHALEKLAVDDLPTTHGHKRKAISE